MQKKLITAELVKEKFTGEDQSDYTLCKLMDYHNTEEAEVLEKDTVKNLLHHAEVSERIYVGTI